MRKWMLVSSVLSCVWQSPSWAWISCEETGDLCPGGNTCCRSCKTSHSTCITGHNVSQQGSCCMDYEAGMTGCGAGFDCASDVNGNASRYYCVKNSNADPTLPDELPRYKLCSLPSKAFTQLNGLPVVSAINDRNASAAPQLAYLSTLGALDSGDPADLQHHLRVRTLVIMIHGSGRNVDDYLCTTNAALPDLQRDPATLTVMVVTPWLLTPDDGPVSLYRKPNIEPLRWAEDGPIDHTWRYGADALNLPFGAYAAVDAIIDFVASSRVRFPSLKRIVVAGHSAGGQYTQRWALLSNSKLFNTNDPSAPVIRTVVANPKGFCYLDARRYVDGDYRLPGAGEIDDCTAYNEWEWGLGEGNDLPTPYKDKAIQEAGGKDAVVARYATRDVVYLSGELDVLPNGYCMERMQGDFRRIRSERFYNSLKEIYGYQVHHRLLVKGVHHDHALMFQSPEGQEALFGLILSS